MRWDVVEALGPYLESIEEANLLMSVHGHRVLASIGALVEWFNGAPKPPRVGEIGAWTGTCGAQLLTRGSIESYLGFESVAKVSGVVRHSSGFAVLPYSEECFAEHAGQCDVVFTSLWLHRVAHRHRWETGAQPTPPQELDQTEAVDQAREHFTSLLRTAAQLATPEGTFLCLIRIRSLVELLGLVTAGSSVGWEMSVQSSGMQKLSDFWFTLVAFERAKPSRKRIDLKGISKWWADQLAMIETPTARQASDAAAAKYLLLPRRRRSSHAIAQTEFEGLVFPGRAVECGSFSGGTYCLLSGEGLEYELVIDPSPAFLEKLRSRSTEDFRTEHAKRLAQQKAEVRKKKSARPELFDQLFGEPGSEPNTPSVEAEDPLLDAFLRNDDRLKRKARRHMYEAEARKNNDFVERWEDWKVFLADQRETWFPSGSPRPSKRSRIQGCTVSSLPGGGAEYRRDPTDVIAGGGRMLVGRDPEERAVIADSFRAVEELTREHPEVMPDREAESPGYAEAFFDGLPRSGSSASSLSDAVATVLRKLTQVIAGATKAIRYHEKNTEGVARLKLCSALRSIATDLRVEDAASDGSVRVGKRKLEFPFASTANAPKTLIQSQQVLFYEVFGKFPSEAAIVAMNEAPSTDADHASWLSAVYSFWLCQEAVRRARARVCELRHHLDYIVHAEFPLPARTANSLRQILAGVEGWLIHAMRWTASQVP